MVTGLTIPGPTNRLLFSYFLQDPVISGPDTFPASGGGDYTVAVQDGKGTPVHQWYVDNVIRCNTTANACYFSISPRYHRMEVATTDATGCTRYAFKYFQAN